MDSPLSLAVSEPWALPGQRMKRLGLHPQMSAEESQSCLCVPLFLSGTYRMVQLKGVPVCLHKVPWASCLELYVDKSKHWEHHRSTEFLPGVLAQGGRGSQPHAGQAYACLGLGTSSANERQQAFAHSQLSFSEPGTFIRVWLLANVTPG